LAANHKPIIRGTDWGIWRRVKTVPFTVKIPDAKQDKKLVDKLKAELPGILNWALLGCREWQTEGLGEPEAVRKATTEYRTEMDILGAFLEECCMVGSEYEAQASELYTDYRKWAEENGERILSQNVFGAALGERGFVSDRFTGGNRVGEAVVKIGRKAGVVVARDSETGKVKYASAHDLRRSFGTRWAKKVMPAVLQRLMRHADIATTMRYYVGIDADDVAADLWGKHSPPGNSFGNSQPEKGFRTGHEPVVCESMEKPE